MPTLNLQPSQNDNQVTLLRKFLQAINFYFGGTLPTQPVNVDVTVNEEGDTIIVPAAPVTTVEAVGNVGGYSYTSFQSQIGAAAAYLAGDAVGPAPKTLPAFRYGQKSAIWQSLTLIDKSNVGPELRIYIGLPGTFAATADNAALAPSFQVEGMQAVLDVASDDWVSIGTTKVASFGGIGKVLTLPPGFTTIEFAVATVTGWTATVANGIKLNFGFLQD